MSELCELFGKLSRRCAFLLSNKYSISVSRSSGSAGGASRGGAALVGTALFDGEESDESEEMGVADPHENLHNYTLIRLQSTHVEMFRNSLFLQK